MNQIMIDNPLTRRLHGLAEPVELIDESGRRVGHSVPTVLVDSDECPYALDELEALRGAAGGRPLAEIWNSLGAR